MTEPAAEPPAEKKGFQFPSTMTVLILVTLLVWIAAFLIPSGTYERDESGVPAPGSYSEIDSPQDFGERVGDLFLAPVNGLYGLQDPETGTVVPFGVGSLFGAVGVFAFVLAIGAFMTMVLASGALDVAIGRLAYAVRARPWLVIVAVMVLFSLLGTTMGWADETLGFYALIIPLMLTLGYDRMVVAGMIIASATVGAMASTVNPFSIGVASEFAGVGIGDGIGLRWIGWIVLTAITIAYVVRYAERIKAKPDRSLVGFLPEDREEVAKEQSAAHLTLTGRQKLVLVITAFTFLLLVFSVIPWDSIIGFETTDPITHETVQNDYWWNLGWWFPELTALFLVAAVVVGVVAGFNEKEITGNIGRGFGDFIGAGVAVVLARGVTVILNNTQTIDTILSWMEDAVSDTSAIGFTSLVAILNTGIAFIIPSSSGHATLAMPLLAPLGDFAEVSRPLVVTAWSWGAGIARFITPTSAVVMAGIALAGVRYDKWIRFMLPLMGLLAVASIAMLAIAAALE
ncbi:MAG: YfcC family protein [Gaiellaceae bacterium]